nr:permease [Numidum massiliense]
MRTAKWIQSSTVNIVGIAIMLFVTFLVFTDLTTWTSQWVTVPSSFLTLNTIFLSILIEALPFVLLGVLIAGGIQVFVTEDHMRRLIPNNKILAVGMSALLGALFPACECGIVPITRRLVAKGVPIYAAIAFLLTGPLINPIVVFSTYMAFGHDWRMTTLRAVVGFFVAVAIACVISLLFKGSQLKRDPSLGTVITTPTRPPLRERVEHMLVHAIDEFFYVSKFLIMGAFLAAIVQTYVASSTLTSLASGSASSSLVMMGLAYLLSLCSEADAFVAASFQHVFPTSALLAFLIYGPMLDLKNTIMMLGVFRTKFVLVFAIVTTVTVFGGIMLAQVWIG